MLGLYEEDYYNENKEKNRSLRCGYGNGSKYDEYWCKCICNIFLVHL